MNTWLVWDFLFLSFFLSRGGLTGPPRLVLNSWSSRLSLQRAEITRMCHHFCLQHMDLEETHVIWNPHSLSDVLSCDCSSPQLGAELSAGWSPVSRASLNPITPKTKLILPDVHDLSVSTEPTQLASHDEQFLKGTVLVVLHNPAKSFF